MNNKFITNNLIIYIKKHQLVQHKYLTNINYLRVI